MQVNGKTTIQKSTALHSSGYQLGDAKGIYSIEGVLNERITAALSEFYTYIVFSVLLIEYDGYIVMLVFGSDE